LLLVVADQEIALPPIRASSHSPENVCCATPRQNFEDVDPVRRQDAVNRGLVVHPLNECEVWWGSDAETAWRAMAPAAAPDKRVLARARHAHHSPF